MSFGVLCEPAARTQQAEPQRVRPVDDLRRDRVAESVGFEPTDRFDTINALAGRPIRPLWQLSAGHAIRRSIAVVSPNHGARAAPIP